VAIVVIVIIIVSVCGAVSVSLGQSNGRVELMLSKLERGRQWSSLGVPGKHDATWLKTSTEGRLLFITLD